MQYTLMTISLFIIDSTGE